MGNKTQKVTVVEKKDGRRRKVPKGMRAIVARRAFRASIYAMWYARLGKVRVWLRWKMWYPLRDLLRSPAFWLRLVLFLVVAAMYVSSLQQHGFTYPPFYMGGGR